MSKSDSNQQGTVYLQDTPEAIRKKIMSAVTDTGVEVIAGEDKPGITNLLSIYSAVTGTQVAAAEAEFSGQGYAPFKRAVADAVIAMLTPVRERYQSLIQDKGYLESVLKQGAETAQKRAWRTLSKVYRKVGYLAASRN